MLTMLIPIGCLWISRDVLGLDDPLSDNVSANVIGLVLGLVARFALFRTSSSAADQHRRDLRRARLVEVFELADATPDPVSESAALQSSVHE